MFPSLLKMIAIKQTLTRPYGEKFEIAGEPIFISDDEVLIDAIEMRSGTLKRMRIPLPVLNVAQQKAA